MDKCQKIVLFLLRLSVGWLMFYAGITKVLNANWSAAGYLADAKTFAGFYNWLTKPNILPIVNFINEWGLTLLGISLLLGIGVRLSGTLGAVLMLLYYFPELNFPVIASHSFIVDEHIIYALVLSFFVAVRAGRVWGLEKWFAKLPLVSKIPKLEKWWG